MTGVLRPRAIVVEAAALLVAVAGTRRLLARRMLDADWRAAPDPPAGRQPR